MGQFDTLDDYQIPKQPHQGHDFHPRDGHCFLDVWKSPTLLNRDPAYMIEEGRLDERQIRGWVDQQTPTTRQEADRETDPSERLLRVLICSPETHVSDGDLLPLPMSEDTFSHLTSAWRMNPALRAAMIHTFPVTTSRSETLGVDERLSLVICGGRSRNWDYCVAATYERSSGTTSCIVQGLETDEIEVLKESIRASQCSFPNPLLIPILLIGLKASRFVAVIEHRARALESLELETGMKYGFSVDPRRNISREALKAKAGLLDFDLITQKLTCIIGTLAFCELTFTASLKALDLLSLFDDKLPASIPREILQQRVLFLRNLVEGVQLNRALLLQRTQAQVQTVCLLPRHALPSTERIDMHYLTSELTSDIWQVFSLIGQKDNRVNIETATSSHRLAEASLKESAAMKEIAEESRNLAFLTQRGNIDMRINAAVTLIFLPGTFIATFFSTSFFDFQSRNDVVSGWIWLYFLFTVVLTMLVLGSWSFGSRRQNQRMERLRNEQREKEKSIEMQS